MIRFEIKKNKKLIVSADYYDKAPLLAYNDYSQKFFF